MIINVIYAAHQEALKKEIERLRRVYHEQNMQKAEEEEEEEEAKVEEEEVNATTTNGGSAAVNMSGTGTDGGIRIC